MTVDQFAAALICEGLADGTVRVYRCMLQRWIDWAITNRRDPHQPDPLAVRAWSSTLPNGKSTRDQARATIGHWCRLLNVDDVSRTIRSPRTTRIPRSRALTDTQVRALLRECDRQGLAGLAVLVGLFTGARRSEIASLAWERIDLEARVLVLDRTKVGDTHEVAICSYLHERLKVRQVPGELWVFPGRYGGHVAPAMIWEMVRDVSRAAGIGHITPHQLRHTIGGAVYDDARDPRAAQDLLGHVDIRQTSRYSSRTRKQIIAALDHVTQRWLDDTGDDEAA